MVVVLGQPGSDPLQHPRMAQVHAIVAHEFAVSWVGLPAGLSHSVPPSWQEPV